jgi:hypothetical protein
MIIAREQDGIGVFLIEADLWMKEKGGSDTKKKVAGLFRC